MIQSLKSYVTSNQKTCLDPDASFFVQYFCQHSEQELGKKRNEGTYIAVIAVFSCLFFLIMLFYLRQSTQILKVVWDVETVTAGDYTVDMHITTDQFLTFVHHHQQKYPQDPQGYAFKKYLKSELE